MRVLYVSKAMTVAAYREKLRALSAHMDMDMYGVIPRRWGRHSVEALDGNGPSILQLDAWFDGQNHLHVYRGLPKVILEIKPNLVHIDEEPYSAVTAQIAHLCRRAGIPTLFFAWQNLHKRLPPPFGSLRAYVFRSVAGGLAGTAQAADVLRRAGYTGPLGVVPQFGVDTVRFSPDSLGPGRLREAVGLDARFVIGFAGRLIPEKGVHLILQALPRLRDAVLVVLGEGPERQRLEHLAASLGVSARVRFVGAVDSNEMANWLQGLDVLVIPSLRKRGWIEQFGRVITEAMACGVPVVGSQSGEIPNVIANTGLTFRENDAAQLTEQLDRLLSDAALRRDLGARGRQRVCENFTHECIAARTSAFYRTVLQCA